MTSAQRMPLFDVGFEWLPKISGGWWTLSDVLIYVMIGYVLTVCVSSVFIEWKTGSRRPIFSALVLKRCLLTVCLLQQLRIISFIVTLLPGASHQCLYTVTDEMKEEKIATFAFDYSPDEASNPEGNSNEWDPPTNWGEVFLRMDASTGCGDLMFSSHTTFAVITTCTVFKYLHADIHKFIISVCMLFLIPLTLMSRKHYTVDVFTALYVGPLMFELLFLKWKDPDSRAELRKKYNIHFEGDESRECCVIVNGERMPINYLQLPYDMRQEPKSRQSIDPLTGDDYDKLESGSDSEEDRSDSTRKGKGDKPQESSSPSSRV